MKKIIMISALLASFAGISSSTYVYEDETISLANAIAECSAEFIQATSNGAVVYSALYQTDRPGSWYTIKTMNNGIHYAEVVISKARVIGTDDIVTTCSIK